MLSMSLSYQLIVYYDQLHDDNVDQIANAGILIDWRNLDEDKVKQACVGNALLEMLSWSGVCILMVNNEVYGFGLWCLERDMNKGDAWLIP